MRKILILAAALLPALAALPSGAAAQAFEKKNYNYSEWAKGPFSEVVTVVNPGKFIFLAGVGAEDENGKGGDIKYLGDFAGQCRYAYDKIKRALAANGSPTSPTCAIRPTSAAAAARRSRAPRRRRTRCSTSCSSPGRACWSRWTSPQRRRRSNVAAHRSRRLERRTSSRPTVSSSTSRRRTRA